MKFFRPSKTSPWLKSRMALLELQLYGLNSNACFPYIFCQSSSGRRTLPQLSFQFIFDTTCSLLVVAVGNMMDLWRNLQWLHAMDMPLYDSKLWYPRLWFRWWTRKKMTKISGFLGLKLSQMPLQVAQARLSHACILYGRWVDHWNRFTGELLILMAYWNILLTLVNWINWWSTG